MNYKVGDKIALDVRNVEAIFAIEAEECAYAQQKGFFYGQITDVSRDILWVEFKLQEGVTERISFDITGARPFCRSHTYGGAPLVPIEYAEKWQEHSNKLNEIRNYIIVLSKINPNGFAHQSIVDSLVMLKQMVEERIAYKLANAEE